jgi:ribulose-phosphate 3-epimerase
VTLNPATSVSALEEALPYADLVLVMSVNPGFGGQRYIPTSAAKVAAIRKRLDDRGLWGVDLEVDGGVTPATIGELVSAGANVFVAGAAVFNSSASVADNIAALRASAQNAATTR